MGVPGFPEALQVLRQDAGGDVHRVLAAACGPVPAWDPVVYLADFSRTVLFPLAPQLPPEQVTGTLGGGRSLRASRWPGAQSRAGSGYGCRSWSRPPAPECWP